MTSLLEKIIEKLAPHHCISCGIEDNILCEACARHRVSLLPPTCLLCGKSADNWQPCCKIVGAGNMWAACAYGGVVEKIIHAYKFERVRAAAAPLSRLMLRVLPEDDWLVVPIPTAPQRVRQRGYDQSVLLARHIAAARGLGYSPALARLQNTRQVGATRVQRQEQSTHLFFVAQSARVRGAKILLVDDVCTTGATFGAAVRVLLGAGVASVDTVAVAWQSPEG